MKKIFTRLFMNLITLIFFAILGGDSPSKDAPPHCATPASKYPATNSAVFDHQSGRKRYRTSTHCDHPCR